jgi:hypothetical protein
MSSTIRVALSGHGNARNALPEIDKRVRGGSGAEPSALHLVLAVGAAVQGLSSTANANPNKMYVSILS